MAYLIILYTIVYTILAVKRLDWAVMIILAVLPSYQIRFNLFGLPMTVLEAMILIAFSVWAIKNKSRIIDNVKLRLIRKSKIPCHAPRSGTSLNLKLLRYPFDWEIAALLIISWVAIIVAGGSNTALGVWKAYFFEPILMFILVINLFTNKTKNNETNENSNKLNVNAKVKSEFWKINKILWALTVSVFWVSGVAIFQKLTGLFVVPEFWPRVTGPFPYPNALGLYLGPIVLILIGWGVQQWKISNFQFPISKQPPIANFTIIFIGLNILLSLVAIILARSEGALAGIIIGLVIMGLFILFQKKFKWIPVGITTLIILFVVFSPLFFLKVVPEYKYFNFEKGSPNYMTDKLMLKDISGEIRKQQWRETWAMLKDNNRWLFGSGISGYQEAVGLYHQEGIFFNFSRDPDFRRKIVWWGEEYKAKHWQPVEIYMYPHNLILNFWTELGLLGAILFMWIIGRYFIEGLRVLKRAENGKKAERFIILGLMGAMIVIVVHGIVDVPYFKNDLAIIFWVLLAILGITQLNYQKPDNTSLKTE